MPTPNAKARLYVQDALTDAVRVTLVGDQAHYISHVMRIRPSESVELFNGRDGEWRASIEEIGKDRCMLRIGARHRPQRPEPGPWLCFAPIKKTRIDFVVEKATELGASCLWPVFTAHTATSRINVRRLSATAVEAAEQCGRLTVPEVLEPATLHDLIARWPSDRVLVVLPGIGRGEPAVCVFSKLAARLENEGAEMPGLLVGPEGGFARLELDALAKLPSVVEVSLGLLVLRAETAALSALACWQAIAGTWRETHQSDLQESP